MILNQLKRQNPSWLIVPLNLLVLRNVNVERGNAADKLNGRNINVSFANNFNVPVEVMIFIFYSDEITIDVKTCLVTRYENSNL